jgi:hypothetical protein
MRAATRAPLTVFAAAAILLDILAFIVLALCRYVYFGGLFPQPVISKLSGVFPGLGSGLRVVPGTTYIAEFFLQNLALAGALIVAAGVIAAAVSRSAPALQVQGGRRRTDILIAIVISQFTFILLSGPDWMEGYRFVSPIVPVLALLAGTFFAGVLDRGTAFAKPLIAAAACLQAIGFGFFVANDSSSVPLWATRNNALQDVPGARSHGWLTRANTHHLRDIPVAQALTATVGELRSLVGDRPVVIMSYQAGFVIYHVAKEHFGAVRFIDLAGLVDDTITGCRLLREETRRLRDESARNGGLGHLAVARYLIRESGKAGTCFAPRPDVIYSMGGEMKFSPEFAALGYELAYDISGPMALATGNRRFYGQYLVDRDLFVAGGLVAARPTLSVGYR